MAAARRSVTAHARRSHHPLRVRRARGVLLRPWVRRRRPRVPLCAAWRAHRVFIFKSAQKFACRYTSSLSAKKEKAQGPQTNHTRTFASRITLTVIHTHTRKISTNRVTPSPHIARHTHSSTRDSRLLCRLSRRRAARSPRSQAWPPRSYQSSHATDCTPWSRTSHGRPWSAPPASASLPCHSPLQ